MEEHPLLHGGEGIDILDILHFRAHNLLKLNVLKLAV
jgi:hypothetical protein